MTNDRAGKKPQRVWLMGVPVDCVTENDALALCQDAIDARKSLRVVPINAAQTILAHENAEFRRTIAAFELALADGKAVAWGAKWVKNLPVPSQVGVPPFTYRLLTMAETRQLSVYFFGASEDVVQRVVARAQQRWPRLCIAGQHNGFFRASEEASIVEKINAAEPDILLVALPSPLKEFWAARYQNALRVPVIVGVGGLFDVMAQKVLAAPEPIRKIGMEWLFRMVQEPRRLFRRYMSTTPLFVFRLFSGYEPH